MLKAETLKRLEERQQELADIFIDETDLTKWPDMSDRVTRGDRFWFKRNAGATATLIVKIQSILDVALKQPAVTDPTDAPPGDDPEEDDAEALAAAAMTEAKRIVDKARGGRFGKPDRKK
jgi:hypothetical protein